MTVAPTSAAAPARPTLSPLIAEALAGLQAPRKTLPCKLLYDAEGSRLFDQITELPEYYPTRTEAGIMAEHAPAMAQALAPIGTQPTRLVELGSGSSTKTRALLDHLPHHAELSSYIPIDISETHLLQTARGLQADYPAIPILPVVADYDQPIPLPDPHNSNTQTTVYFPGSTLGNFAPRAAQRFLRRLAGLTTPTRANPGRLLIGIDLVKPVPELLAAYDDAAGVTAAFNLNLLHRLNREADADFNPDAFKHEARWDPDHARIEMHLVSLADQTATVAGQPVYFDRGETIWTESSHKYTHERFAQLADAWTLDQTWTDPDERFAVYLLTTR
ncbi:MAG: L-histidine N(alpha)-methyltransferase [Planctomycetota bacterium]